jgi:hypothetical protein
MKKIMGVSGRFDTTHREIHAMLASNFEEHEVDASLHTETAPLRVRMAYATYAHRHHLHLVHFRGRDGQAECLILSKQPVTDHKLHRLTDLTMERGHPVHVYMPTALVDGIWLGAVHTPAHNFGLREGVHNTAVYLDMLKGLRRAVADMPGRRAIHGDWNLSVDNPHFENLLLEHHPRMHFLVPDKPTEGLRQIDALMTTESGHAVTLDPLSGFDHRRVLNHLG